MPRARPMAVELIEGNSYNECLTLRLGCLLLMSDFSPFSAPLGQAASGELKEFYSISEGWHVEYKSLPIPPKALAKR